MRKIRRNSIDFTVCRECRDRITDAGSDHCIDAADSMVHKVADESTGRNDHRRFSDAGDIGQSGITSDISKKADIARKDRSSGSNSDKKTRQIQSVSQSGSD